MSADLPSCPSCASKQIVKNGKIHNGKQNHKCRDCGRQFVQDPKKKVINQETKNLIDKLLLEKIPLAGIARVTDVCERSAKGATHVRASDSLRLASPGGLRLFEGESALAGAVALCDSPTRSVVGSLQAATLLRNGGELQFAQLALQALS